MSAVSSFDRYPNLNSIGKLIQMREDFLEVASHELKTPLTSLKLQVQLISKIAREQEQVQSTPEKLQILAEDADRQITRMTELINSLLEASGIRAGRLELYPHEFDLSEAVLEEIKRFQSVPSFSHLSFRAHTEVGVRGRWDRSRVLQVVRSLLSNAATYGLKRPVEVSVWSDHGKAKVSIRDYGMGISKEDRERIFDLFERGVPASKYGGLGIGLYIAHQIALAHGGSLEVESELGQGSTFILTLPLSRAKGVRRAALKGAVA